MQCTDARGMLVASIWELLLDRSLKKDFFIGTKIETWCMHVYNLKNTIQRKKIVCFIPESNTLATCTHCNFHVHIRFQWKHSSHSKSLMRKNMTRIHINLKQQRNHSDTSIPNFLRGNNLNSEKYYRLIMPENCCSALTNEQGHRQQKGDYRSIPKVSQDRKPLTWQSPWPFSLF